MTRAPIYATNPEVLAVDVEADADEYITAGDKVSKINEYIDEMEIDFEEKQNMEACKVTLNTDIWKYQHNWKYPQSS